ncbi:MAG: hypothetical protein M3P18_04530, partial [Actinomycetota bacterium]|nr:hypothetical protein [Actinomycetota bacterium]
APLSAAANLQDMVTAILAGTVSSGAAVPDRALKIRSFLAKYVGTQKLIGVSINFAALAPDVPKLSNPFSMLEFIRDTFEQLSSSGVKGMFLVLDEIDGVAGQAFFGQFLKGIVDKNALSDDPLPLLILVCGTDQHLQDMAAIYEPIARVFSPIIDIEALTDAEMATFFREAFSSVGMTVADDALDFMTEQSGGLPRFLHLVGDAAYWADTDNVVTLDDAMGASLRAADEIGKYVNHQVYEALRSRDYKSILLKIGGRHPTKMTFRRRDVASGLSEQQRKKLDNFLQRMQRMGVIGKGEEQGEYVFKTRLVRLFIWLQAWRKEHPTAGEKLTEKVDTDAATTKASDLST